MSFQRTSPRRQTRGNSPLRPSPPPINPAHEGYDTDPLASGPASIYDFAVEADAPPSGRSPGPSSSERGRSRSWTRRQGGRLVEKNSLGLFEPQGQGTSGPVPLEQDETPPVHHDSLGVDSSPMGADTAPTPHSVRIPLSANSTSIQSISIESWKKASSGHRPIPKISQDVDSVDRGLQGDTAVWKRYYKEAVDNDQLMIENWNLNMDSILIFAGLFSGILTAFIIEFYRMMKVEQDDLAAQILLDIDHLLRHSLSNSTLPLPEPRSNFEADEYDFESTSAVVWLNALWFSSLALSLGTAISAMVVKQWFQFYSENLNSGNAHMDALHRQYRYNALRRWKVPTIVSFLPLMMHASVALFLAGLVVVLWLINEATAIVVLTLSIGLLFIYLLSTLMPLIDQSCPYKSTALVLLQHFIHRAHIGFWLVVHRISGRLNFSIHDVVILSVRAKVEARNLVLFPLGAFNSIRENLKKTGTDFMKSPREFSKRHLVAARDTKRNNWENKKVEEKRSVLDIDAIFWLIKSSGKQDLVDMGLLCIPQLKPEANLVNKCLKGNVQGLLIRKAYLPLPSRDHDTWKKLTIATPENCLRDVSRLPGIGQYMQSLMYIWHHPVYFDEHPPSVISDSQVWGLPSYDSPDERPVLRTGSKSSVEHELALEAPKYLFGDWLMLWRSLKVASGDDLKWIYYRGWDLDVFAMIVCTEAHYYELKHGHISNSQGALQRADVDDPSPYSDLYDLVKDYSLKLDITDDTLACVVDSYTYVISKSQGDHILLSTDSLIALLNLLTTRQLIYDNVLQKLILCLNMFTLPDWKRRQKVKTYWKKGGTAKFDRPKAYEELCIILFTLRRSYLARSNDADNDGKAATIVQMTESLLFEASLEQDVPLPTYDEMFISVPSDRAKFILDQISNSDRLHEWRSPNTLGWMITLLYKWYDKDDADLPLELQEQIIAIFHQLLCFSWRGGDLDLVCRKILPFWASNLDLLDTETEMANATARYACLTLKSLFHREEDQRASRALILQFGKHKVFDKAFILLQSSEYCTPENKADWARIRRLWKEEVLRTGLVHVDERRYYSGLKAALPAGGTPHLPDPELRDDGDGSSRQSGVTPSRQPIILRKNVGTRPLDTSTQAYSPPPSARAASFNSERLGPMDPDPERFQPGIS